MQNQAALPLMVKKNMFSCVGISSHWFIRVRLHLYSAVMKPNLGHKITTTQNEYTETELCQLTAH